MISFGFLIRIFIFIWNLDNWQIYTNYSENPTKSMKLAKHSLGRVWKESILHNIEKVF